MKTKSPLLQIFVRCMSVTAMAGCAITPASADTLKPVWAIVPDGTILDDGVAPPEAGGVLLPAGLTVANTFNAYSWFTPSNAVRGVAANSANGNVLVSDTSQNIQVLNSAGVFSHVLDKTGLTTGATLNMVHVGVAADGVVYASNLSATAPPNSFKIWRWENDGNPNPDPLPDPFVPVAPTLAWPPPVVDGEPVITGDPAAGLNNQRWGDSMDVRGSGANTQLVFAARANPVLAIFTTTDGLNFVPHVVTYAGGANTGVAFGPDITGYDDPATTGTVENLTLTTVFVKLSGSPLRRVRIRTDNWTAVATTVYDGTGSNPPAIAGTITAIGTDPRQRYLAGVSGRPTSASDTAKGQASGYEFGAAAVPNLIAPDAPGVTDFFTANVNGNGIAAADVFTAAPGQTPGTGGIPQRSRLYLLNVNNAIVAYDVAPLLIAPGIATSPASTTVIAGWKATFSVSATGSLPLTYQWTRDGIDIPGATSPSYTLDPAGVADTAAVFAVRVTNFVSTVPSGDAILTVQPRVDTGVMTLGYKLPSDTLGRPYLTSTDTQRGMAHNPGSDHLLIVNRTTVPGLPNPSVVVLNAANGAEIMEGDMVRTLRMRDPDNSNNDVVTESGAATNGFFALSAIDCDAAGVIYGSNLAIAGATDQFKIYRWASDDAITTPTVAYGPGDIFNTAGTGDRAGEHLKVRGSGLSTQILAGARNVEKFAILTTTDGLTFAPTVFEVTGAGNFAFFMCDFGAGNTIWAKTDGGRLLRIAFNLTTGLAGIEEIFSTALFPSGVGPITVDPVKQILGAVHSGENPNNLRLYNYNQIGQPGGLLDLEFFPTDNLNGNRVGAADMGNNRIYGLDTNNGLVVMNINYTLPVAPVLTNPSLTGNTFSFTLTGVAGATYLIQNSPDMASWNDDGTVTLNVGTSAVVSRTVTDGRYFFRAKTQ